MEWKWLIIYLVERTILITRVSVRCEDASEVWNREEERSLRVVIEWLCVLKKCTPAARLQCAVLGVVWSYR
jgi:hypothetical protein